MHLQLKEMEKLEQDKIKLQEEKNQLQLTVEMKEMKLSRSPKSLKSSKAYTIKRELHSIPRFRV